MVGTNVVTGLKQQEMVVLDSCSVRASEVLFSLSPLLPSVGRKLTQTPNTASFLALEKLGLRSGQTQPTVALCGYCDLQFCLLMSVRVLWTTRTYTKRATEMASILAEV